MAKLEGWLGLLTSQRCAFGRSLERFKQITLKSFRCPGLLNVLLRNVWLKGNVFWEVHYFSFKLKLWHPFPVWTVWKWTSVFGNCLLFSPQVLSALCAPGSLSDQWEGNVDHTLQLSSLSCLCVRCRPAKKGCSDMNYNFQTKQELHFWSTSKYNLIVWAS